MIGVDLSKPDECRTSLLAWLQFLRHQLDYSYFKVLSDAEVSAKKAQNEAYISSVRDRANMMNLKDLLCNFGVPLIVVGCKSDSLTVNDLTQLKKHEDAQREIRNICMKGIVARILLISNYRADCMRNIM